MLTGKRDRVQGALPESVDGGSAARLHRCTTGCLRVSAAGLRAHWWRNSVRQLRFDPVRTNRYAWGAVLKQRALHRRAGTGCRIRRPDLRL